MQVNSTNITELPTVLFSRPRMIGVANTFTRSPRIFFTSHSTTQRRAQAAWLGLEPHSSSRPILIVFSFISFSAQHLFLKGDRLVLLLGTDLIVTDSPFDLLCGHSLDINKIMLCYLIFLSRGSPHLPRRQHYERCSSTNFATGMNVMVLLITITQLVLCFSVYSVLQQVYIAM